MNPKQKDISLVYRYVLKLTIEGGQNNGYMVRVAFANNKMKIKVKKKQRLIGQSVLDLWRWFSDH